MNYITIRCLFVELWCKNMLYHMKNENLKLSVNCLLQWLTAPASGETLGLLARLAECVAGTSHYFFVLLKKFPTFLQQCFNRKQHTCHLLFKNSIIQRKSLSQRPKTNITIERCNEYIEDSERMHPSPSMKRRGWGVAQPTADMSLGEGNHL